MSEPAGPWYRDGLAFTCTRCGNCCTGAPGYVWVNDDELSELAALVGLDVQTFSRKYVRQVGARRSLIEKRNGDCVFWDKVQGCTVYEARPVQCRTWPFWRQNLETPDDWNETCRVCPGSGHGTLVPLEAIQAQVERTPSPFDLED